MKNEVEYGARGILGLLVPQANTTAEPEVQIMLDPDIALLTGRLTSPQPEMRERLATLNPAASAKIADRLIEAHKRGYWTPDPDLLLALQTAGEELEDRLEGVTTEIAA